MIHEEGFINNNTHQRRLNIYRGLMFLFYAMVIFSGAITFFFDQGVIAKFRTCGAPEQLTSLVVFEVIMLRYGFYTFSFFVVIVLLG